MPGFVDVHSHVIPSGDDGAKTVAEGLELCRLAAAEGTRILYGTPHAQPADSWCAITPERYELAVRSYQLMKDECADFGLELRLGWEVAPGGILTGGIRDYVLEGTNAVLVEFPGPWFSFEDPLAATRRQVTAIRAAGLDVILAHPERCPAIQHHPERARVFAAEGALLCFNADSFIGAHDARSERCAWQLVDLGLGDLIASDAHRPSRPSRMREAFEALSARCGSERALALADGSGLAAVYPAEGFRARSA
jgi:protein-tyrosine phosphatase